MISLVQPHEILELHPQMRRVWAFYWQYAKKHKRQCTLRECAAALGMSKNSVWRWRKELIAKGFMEQHRRYATGTVRVVK